jgi:hypothetical protein
MLRGMSASNAAGSRRSWSNILRMVAISYAMKSLLVALAWLAIPDLPERAVAKVQDAWVRLVGRP